jgi:protein transport protein SEC61 subunit gamma-like protein
MDILKKTWNNSWKYQTKVEVWLKNLGKGKYGRVLKMSRKPSSEDYSKTLMITGIGIVLIGGMGFAIYLIWKYFPDFFKWALGL